MEPGLKRTLWRWTCVLWSLGNGYLILSISQVWGTIVFMPNGTKLISLGWDVSLLPLSTWQKHLCFSHGSIGSSWKESSLEGQSNGGVKGHRRAVKIQKSRTCLNQGIRGGGSQPEKGHALCICSLGVPGLEETCRWDCPKPNPLTLHPAREGGRNRGCWERGRMKDQ